MPSPTLLQAGTQRRIAIAQYTKPPAFQALDRVAGCSIAAKLHPDACYLVATVMRVEAYAATAQHAGYTYPAQANAWRFVGKLMQVLNLGPAAAAGLNL